MKPSGVGIGAVPAAFGMIVAARGDVQQAVIGAVNMGNDADTVATIVGAVTATRAGIDAVPREWVDLVQRANQITFRTLAERMARASQQVKNAQ